MGESNRALYIGETRQHQIVIANNQQTQTPCNKIRLCTRNIKSQAPNDGSVSGPESNNFIKILYYP